MTTEATDLRAEKITTALIEQGRKSATGECLFLDRLHVEQIVEAALASVPALAPHPQP